MSHPNLTEYNKKRDFKKSPEPKGGNSKPGSARFVIQKYDAQNLHFDFRLEIAGVLKSWVIPKGPFTNPADKRLAIPTEDHPIDYIDFEGVIPEGQYGAGTVMVWDNGTFKNLLEENEEEKSLEESYKDGKMEVWLEGKKISGGYTLIKTNMGNNWLIIKKDDKEADARRKPAKTENESVKTGRSMKEISTSSNGKNE
ncbi:DNA ligase [Marivirga sp. S37H4]|uniref:DNA ligase n=1 Tax=Marivirga aurantiaca TaxID=2802615 RepID=A0A935C7E9_9BACT|nr:DNA polymerase ligase N-terminal domain-containing protein [Marivirga aurantiaca]MBK6264971.1 DNA ligase [Marivirga aurantiaca]